MSRINRTELLTKIRACRLAGPRMRARLKKEVAEILWPTIVQIACNQSHLTADEREEAAMWAALRLLERLDNGTLPLEPYTWLWKIIREYEHDNSPTLQIDPDPDAWYDNIQDFVLLFALHQELAKLDYRGQEIIYRRFWEGETYDKIGSVLGISRARVGERHSGVRFKLRMALIYG